MSVRPPKPTCSLRRVDAGRLLLLRLRCIRAAPTPPPLVEAEHVDQRVRLVVLLHQDELGRERRREALRLLIGHADAAPEPLLRGLREQLAARRGRHVVEGVQLVERELVEARLVLVQRALVEQSHHGRDPLGRLDLALVDVDLQLRELDARARLGLAQRHHAVARAHAAQRHRLVADGRPARGAYLKVDHGEVGLRRVHDERLVPPRPQPVVLDAARRPRRAVLHLVVVRADARVPPAKDAHDDKRVDRVVAVGDVRRPALVERAAAGLLRLQPRLGVLAVLARLDQHDAAHERDLVAVEARRHRVAQRRRGRQLDVRQARALAVLDAAIDGSLARHDARGARSAAEDGRARAGRLARAGRRAVLALAHLAREAEPL
mmetsp:Transcript_90875/g.272900  ORF Transcript_90875/g.272900 Transcript_90875/m.272900 type:complete len:378 (+) Transcript_90875:307-1440(+)